jgi:hypothetical protein
MGQTRFYKPRRARLTGGEKDFMFNQNLARQYRIGIDPDFDFVAFAESRPIMTRRTGMRYDNNSEDWEPEYFRMGPFQITYNFSNAVRKNSFPVKPAVMPSKATGEYGATGWSFRALYEFLCEGYNGGVPFIDTYFDRVFKTRSVYADFMRIYETIQDSINNEHQKLDKQLNLFNDVKLKADGTPDMRFNTSKRCMDYKVWQDQIIYQECKTLAKEIRNDIVLCLRTGKLPLRGKENPVAAQRTRRIREKFPVLHADRLFYASGQLINNLNIYVEIGEKGESAA